MCECLEMSKFTSKFGTRGNKTFSVNAAVKCNISSIFNKLAVNTMSV